MGLKLSVKIGSVTNLSDARYAAGMGVDYIGFNIDPNSKYTLEASKFNEIINWVSGVNIIGEIGNNIPENNEEYGSYLIETSNVLLSREAVYKINGRSLSFNSIKKLVAQHQDVTFYVVELSPLQINEHEQALKELCNKYSIYISSSFSQALLELITTSIQPQGIEIKGGLEEQPGFKDYDGIADVLEWLEDDE